MLHMQRNMLRQEIKKFKIKRKENKKIFQKDINWSKKSMGMGASNLERQAMGLGVYVTN